MRSRRARPLPAGVAAAPAVLVAEDDRRDRSGRDRDDQGANAEADEQSARPSGRLLLLPARRGGAAGLLELLRRPGLSAAVLAATGALAGTAVLAGTAGLRAAVLAGT